MDKINFIIKNNENIESIIKIQKWWRKILFNKSNTEPNNLIDKLIKLEIESNSDSDINNKNIEQNNDDISIEMLSKGIESNNKEHNLLFIKCFKILKKYPPSKNENKFLYGKLIEKAIIDFLDTIFHSCIELDNLQTIGSQYKYDCKLNFTEDQYKNLSIKAKKNKNGPIIIINKNSNNKTYDLSDLITILTIIELKEIIIIPHNIIPKNFIQDNNSNILYKSSLLTYLHKELKYKKYIINLTENNEFKNFYENSLMNIKPHQYINELYNDL